MSARYCSVLRDALNGRESICRQDAVANELVHDVAQPRLAVADRDASRRSLSHVKYPQSNLIKEANALVKLLGSGGGGRGGGRCTIPRPQRPEDS